MGLRECENTDASGDSVFGCCDKLGRSTLTSMHWDGIRHSHQPAVSRQEQVTGVFDATKWMGQGADSHWSIENTRVIHYIETDTRRIMAWVFPNLEGG